MSGQEALQDCRNFIPFFQKEQVIRLLDDRQPGTPDLFLQKLGINKRHQEITVSGEDQCGTLNALEIQGPPHEPGHGHELEHHLGGVLGSVAAFADQVVMNIGIPGLQERADLRRKGGLSPCQRNPLQKRPQPSIQWSSTRRC